jgi:hypothetical protein
MVSGVSYATLGFITWLCTPNCPSSSGYVVLAFFVLLAFGAMVALASLHVIQGQRLVRDTGIPGSLCRSGDDFRERVSQSRPSVVAG